MDSSLCSCVVLVSPRSLLAGWYTTVVDDIVLLEVIWLPMGEHFLFDGNELGDLVIVVRWVQLAEFEFISWW